MKLTFGASRAEAATYSRDRGTYFAYVLDHNICADGHRVIDCDVTFGIR